MTDASRRTAVDDDALLDRLRALARGGRAFGGLPDRPFPPLTAAEVEHVERQLGYRLPPLLRRMYTEIGDGGFGPEGGLAPLTPRRYGSKWYCAIPSPERGPEYRPPRSWLFLTGGGCSMRWHVSLIAVDHPVLLWDADGWEPDWGESPHDGLRYAAPSLRQWLWTWADGGRRGVWHEAHALHETVSPH